MITAGIKETRQHFTEYLSKVEEGEEIIITKRSEPIAIITPITKDRRGKLASHKDLRDKIQAIGKPLSSVVVELRKGERY